MVAYADSAEVAEIRADIARHQIVLYRLAAVVDLHPSHLGQMLNGRRPLPQVMAQRIRNAIPQLSSAGASPGDDVL